MRMDLSVNLGDNLWYRGGASTPSSRGPAHPGRAGDGLRATGAIRTVSGTYDAYGRKLSIEHGTLTFFGSVENPSLDVRALRKGLPVEAGVEVTGNVARPRVRLVSQPDVPDPEKISWLVLGARPATCRRAMRRCSLRAARLARAQQLGGRHHQAHRLRRGEGRPRGHAERARRAAAKHRRGKTGTAAAGEVVSIGQAPHERHLRRLRARPRRCGRALRVTWQITQAFQMLLRARYQPGVDAVYRWTFE
jgi:translocation and assembly module TamB